MEIQEEEEGLVQMWGLGRQNGFLLLTSVGTKILGPGQGVITVVGKQKIIDKW